MPCTPPSLVRQLSWVLVGAIAVSTLLTLASQPASYWADPTTAIRGDGLSLYHPSNRTFDFFLGHGPAAFLAANLVYASLAYFVVSRLPDALAVTAAFSALFAHGYGATNWLGTHYHLGVAASPALWGTVCGIALSFAILPTADRPDLIVKHWRWLMVVTLGVDFTNTLLGQPDAYWLDSAAQEEGNHLVRLFLGKGWLHYVALDLAIGLGEFLFVMFLPLPLAFVGVYAFTFGNFAGASNWFFYTWRMGWIVPVAYGVLISAMMILPIFHRGFRHRQT